MRRPQDVQKHLMLITVICGADHQQDCRRIVTRFIWSIVERLLSDQGDLAILIPIFVGQEKTVRYSH